MRSLASTTTYSRSPARRGPLVAAAALVAAVFATPVRAQTTTWTGAASTAWTDVRNWTAGIPTPLVDARIAAAARNPSTTNVPALCRSLTIDANARLTTSTTRPLTVHGSASVAGTVTAGGLLVFAGSGTITTAATSPLPDVTIAGTSYAFPGPTVIRGALLHTAGTIRVAATLTVGGATTIRGLAITGSGTLDLDGPVALNPLSALTAPPRVVRCSGPWTSTALFTPKSGTVVFDGTGTQSVTVAPNAFRWFHLTVAAGATVATQYDIVTGGTLDVAGELRTTGARVLVGGALTVSGRLLLPSAAADVGGACTVGTNGTLDLGSGVHALRGDFTNDGRVRGAARLELHGSAAHAVTNRGTFTDQATLVFRGTGGATASFPAPVPAVTVDAAGGVTFATTSAITGGLSLKSGKLRVLAGVLGIGGAGTFSGGTLTSSAAESSQAVLDIEGDATFTGTAADKPPLIRVAGNWTSGPRFHPKTGTVELDGTRDTQIRGLSPAFNPRFHLLVIKNGTRRPGSDIAIDAKGATIEASGRLATGPRRVQVKCFGIDVRGTLEVAAGGRVEADRDSSIDVRPGGTLRLAGRPGTPAVIAGLGAGGYGARLGGRVEAVHFRFEGMGAKGIQMLATARLAAPPRDFRAGTFARGSAAKDAVLLDVAYTDTTKPLRLPFLTFENSPRTATFNVRTRTAGALTMDQWGGAFGGESFDDDPAGKITWSQRPTTDLVSFLASGEVGAIRLRFETRTEADVKQYRLLRATRATGPFTEVPGSPLAAKGGSTPASYGLLDAGLQFGTRYYYRLREVLVHDVERRLATDSARPWRASIGSSLFVGPRSPTKTIAAALRAVPARGTVFVAAGDYGAFTVTKPVRILAYGPGTVRVDTRAAPVVITGMRMSDAAVTLSGLQIGTGTGSLGVQVTRCHNVVVLDALAVHALRSPEGVLLDDAPRVAIQSCALRGKPGLRVRNGSCAYASRGAVDALVAEQRSMVVLAALKPGSTRFDATSRVRSLPGPMPALAFPSAAQSDKLVPTQVSGTAGSPFSLMLAPQKAFVDVSSFLPIDMALLLDPGSLTVVHVGVVPAGGVARIGLPVPDRPAVWGAAAPFQGVVFDLARLRGRWTNVRDLIALP